MKRQRGRCVSSVLQLRAGERPGWAVPWARTVRYACHSVVRGHRPETTRLRDHGDRTEAHSQAGHLLWSCSIPASETASVRLAAFPFSKLIILFFSILDLAFFFFENVVSELISLFAVMAPTMGLRNSRCLHTEGRRLISGPR